MNDDLISRKALLSGFDVRKVTEYDESGCGVNYKAVPVKAIEAAPAVDAEPAKHGKWIEHYAYGAWHYDCPFCDDGYATKKREKKPENYCSNCGAKLDKEK